MTKANKVKEEIIRRLLYSIKDVDVLKRVGVMSISFAKNVESEENAKH